MSDFVILVPVLNRPRNARRLVNNIEHACVTPQRLLFICSPDDKAEIAACKRTGADVTVVDWVPGPADWAKKLEWGRALTTEPYMLLAADDLNFHRCWDQRASQVLAQMEIGVLGTQDGGNPLVQKGMHSTHPIVSRAYINAFGTIDQKHLMLHQGYDHQYCDNELCETAMARGYWHFARDVYIEHLHPAWGKAAWDHTYRKGYAKANADFQLFQRRRRLWRPRGYRGAPRRPRGLGPARDQTGVNTPSARYGQIAHRRPPA